MSIPQDFIISTTAMSGLYYPGATIATLADGRALVTWVGEDTDNTKDWFEQIEIRARWYNADGTPAGDDFIVNTTREGNQFAPSATATADGKVIITWNNENTSLRGIILDPDAPGTTTDFQLTMDTQEFGAANAEPKVTALSDGRFFVVWESNDAADGDGYCVEGRLFAADGTALGDTMVLNSTTAGFQFNPDVTELSDGRILVTFDSESDGNPDGDSVRALVISADGSLQGPDVQLNTTTDGLQVSGDVAALADGRAVAVWYEEGSDSDQKGSYIRAQVIGADGQPEGDDFVVNATDIVGTSSLPAISALAGGGALVVWQAYETTDGVTYGNCLRGRLLNADGQPVSMDFVINSTTGYSFSTPAVEALADGRVLVSWHSFEVGSDSEPTEVVRGVCFTPVVGAESADALAGTAGRDAMFGFAGADVLTGGVGDDSQMGGTGQDRLLGGAGDDLMMGETGADVLNGGVGDDSQMGGTGQDKLLGGTGDDLMMGETGADILTGGVGDDSQMGGTGQDKLNGGAGEDVLTGGAGRDILTGGSDADTFYFDMGFGRDKIMDFSDGDMLQISDEMWSGTAESLVADHAWVTDDGVMIDLGGGDRISLVGIGTLDGLADAITFL